MEGFLGVYCEYVLGWVYMIYLSNNECYYLCFLLYIVWGVIFYIYLKIVNGVEYFIFYEVCSVLCLLDDDWNWDDIFEEVVVSDIFIWLWYLFVIMIVFCGFVYLM